MNELSFTGKNDEKLLFVKVQVELPRGNSGRHVAVFVGETESNLDALQLVHIVLYHGILHSFLLKSLFDMRTVLGALTFGPRSEFSFMEITIPGNSVSYANHIRIMSGLRVLTIPTYLYSSAIFIIFLNSTSKLSCQTSLIGTSSFPLYK